MKPAFGQFFLMILFISSCVPKTRYDDQQVKLEQTQSKLKDLELTSAECDKDLFVQLREQAQSLDLLTQELVDRNTELSKEVARLKVLESATKSEESSCQKRLNTQAKEFDEKFARLRDTNEDLQKELKKEIQNLKSKLEKFEGDSNRKKPSTKAPASTQKPKSKAN